MQWLRPTKNGGIIGPVLHVSQSCIRLHVLTYTVSENLIQLERVPKMGKAGTCTYYILAPEHSRCPVK